MLRALQMSLDLHAAGCGDPVRGILLNPFDFHDLDWPDYRGIPIEADESLPTGVVRIDCLTTTVQAAIKEFRAALREGDGAIAEAEVRLEAKLEALGQVRDEWWKVTRRPGWWKEQAARAREEAAEDRIRDAERRIREAGGKIPDDKRESPENELRAWLDAWSDMVNDDIPEDILEGLEEGLDDGLADRLGKGKSLPRWLIEGIQDQTNQRPLRPYDQAQAEGIPRKGWLRRLGSTMRKWI